MNNLEKVDEKMVEDILVAKNRQILAQNETKRMRRYAREAANGMVGDLPLIYLCNYIKEEDEEPHEGVSEDTINREMIWCFKHDSNDFSGDAYYLTYKLVISAFASQMRNAFGNYLHKMMVIPVPCSDGKRYAERWGWAIGDLCAALGEYHSKKERPEDGYGAVKYEFFNPFEDDIPEHYCKGHLPMPRNYTIDTKRVKDKNVIILDDLVCTGQHVTKFRKEIEDAGGHVICAMVIGKTKKEN